MFGELRKEVGEILGKVCRMEGVTIIKAATLPDHVHMYVSIPPKLSVSKAVGLIKGKSALMIFDRHPEYREKGNRHFWARGYYCETVGNVNEETIKSIFRNSTKEIGWSIKREPLLSGLPVKKERFASSLSLKYLCKYYHMYLSSGSMSASAISSAVISSVLYVQ